MLLRVPLLNQIVKQFAKVVVSDQITLLTRGVAHGALVLPVHHLEDARFAKRVPALSYVWVVKGLETDYTFSMLTNDLVDANSNCLVIFGLLFLEAWLVLYNNVFYHDSFWF